VITAGASVTVEVLMLMSVMLLMTVMTKATTVGGGGGCGGGVSSITYAYCTNKILVDQCHLSAAGMYRMV